jgi:hypothetical protein
MKRVAALHLRRRREWYKPPRWAHDNEKAYKSWIWWDNQWVMYERGLNG